MIAIACDHGGFELKKAIIAHLTEKGVETTDFGCYDGQSCDYPDLAHPLADAVVSGEFDCGILCCGTGIGMSIAANKHPGIRAAHVTDLFSAKATREHNDANVLCLGGRITETPLALEIVDVFLDTPFSNDERHIRRINKIEV